MDGSGSSLLLIFTFCALSIGGVWSTFGYYKSYTLFGTGDTMIQTWDQHRGSQLPTRKWNVECLDGEAMIGILDNADDYTRMWYVWCKFMFPYKPPTQGVYPYYPSCHVRNFTTQFFCYTPQAHERTVNTFVTGIWGRQWNFIISRLQNDGIAPYKCCKTPNGYYLDYTACYYQPTRDVFWEYYDTPSYFLVFCATGYVMTGLAKQINPYTRPDAHVEWIQCCRVGFGIVPLQPPPRNDSIGYKSTYDNSTNYGHQNIKAYNYNRPRPHGAQSYSRFAEDPDKARYLVNDHEDGHVYTNEDFVNVGMSPVKLNDSVELDPDVNSMYSRVVSQVNSFFNPSPKSGSAVVYPSLEVNAIP